jgi:hypothetical protein
MVLIEPVKVGLPPKIANHIIVRVEAFYTNAVTASVFYSVQNKEYEELLSGTYEMTEEEYNGWEGDNTYVEDVVLNYLGLKRRIV